VIFWGKGQVKVVATLSYLHALAGHNMPKKLEPTLKQMTFVWFQFQVDLSKALQDQSYMTQVIVKRARHDNTIINKNQTTQIH